MSPSVQNNPQSIAEELFGHIMAPLERELGRASGGQAAAIKRKLVPLVTALGIGLSSGQHQVPEVESPQQAAVAFQSLGAAQQVDPVRTMEEDLTHSPAAYDEPEEGAAPDAGEQADDAHEPSLFEEQQQAEQDAALQAQKETQASAIQQAAQQEAAAEQQAAAQAAAQQAAQQTQAQAQTTVEQSAPEPKQQQGPDRRNAERQLRRVDKAADKKIKPVQKTLRKVTRAKQAAKTSELGVKAALRAEQAGAYLILGFLYFALAICAVLSLIGIGIAGLTTIPEAITTVYSRHRQIAGKLKEAIEKIHEAVEGLEEIERKGQEVIKKIEAFRNNKSRQLIRLIRGDR